jgi:pyruvate/2-oxoglutarate dehydrogenase complex dihydrolipoamide dehydrogenase (E3) component
VLVCSTCIRAAGHVRQAGGDSRWNERIALDANLRSTSNAATQSPVRGNYAETAAWAKVLIDKQTHRVIGAHILGHGGEELIHLFALAMLLLFSANER